MTTPLDTLAGIRPGFAAQEVVDALGPPGPGGTSVLLAATSGRYVDPASGRWFWAWEYFLPESSLCVELEAPAEDGPYTVRAVIGHGRGVRTDRGVEVGCSPEEVRAAYRDVVLDQIDHPHEDIFVLRSGDLLFRFTGGHAGTIVLGTPLDVSGLEPATFPAPPRALAAP